MKKLFTFLLGACMCTFVMAQRPEAIIAKAGDVVPVIDGVLDEVWATVEQHNVDKPFGIATPEVPTLGDEGTTYWKALWDASGLYIIIVANDDVWFPYTGTGDAYTFDKIELYFDTNDNLLDGVGGQNLATGNRQIAPDPTLTKIDGELLTTAILGGTVQYAFKVENPAWTTEWFVPWESIPNGDGVLFDKMGTMGFDVSISDNDNDGAGRKRAVWANVGTINEDWGNMDDAGHLTFEGAEAGVYVDKVTVTGGSITTDNGTVQLTALIEPAEATNQVVKWSIVDGAGLAKISADGLVTAVKDGVVTVKAAATDGGWSEGTATVTISGQVITKDDAWNSLNKITGWDFNDDKTGDFPTSWGGWVDVAAAGCEAQVVPAIEDGVVVMKVGLAVDAANWHYQLNQGNLTCEPNIPYTLKFKTWASADATPCAVDFESTATADLYSRYGSSPDAESVNGSEWHYNANMEPIWYTFHVTFDKMVPTTGQKIQWMNSLSNETIYLDSVLLISDADLALATSVKQLAKNSPMKVYPNPVGTGNELNVNLVSAKGKVAIYNAVGQKLMEKVATGNLVKFNVSSLRKGMYFVRLDDGTSQKFIK